MNDKFQGITEEVVALSVLQRKINGLMNGTGGKVLLGQEDLKELGFARLIRPSFLDFLPITAYPSGSAPVKKTAPELKSIFNKYYQNNRKGYQYYADNGWEEGGFGDTLDM